MINYMEMDEITKFFKTNKVKIIKLNHSLDQSTQKATRYDGYLHLLEDETFEIVIKKPSKNFKYILEADPLLIEQEKRKF